MSSIKNVQKQIFSWLGERGYVRVRNDYFQKRIDSELNAYFRPDIYFKMYIRISVTCGYSAPAYDERVWKFLIANFSDRYIDQYNSIIRPILHFNIIKYTEHVRFAAYGAEIGEREDFFHGMGMSEAMLMTRASGLEGLLNIIEVDEPPFEWLQHNTLAVYLLGTMLAKTFGRDMKKLNALSEKYEASIQGNAIRKDLSLDEIRKISQLI